MLKKPFFLPVVCLSLLLIPLIGMQFYAAIQWTLFDFALMGLLLIALGLSIRWVIIKTIPIQRKRAFIVLLLMAFLIVCAALAVGVFGTPFAGS